MRTAETETHTTKRMAVASVLGLLLIMAAIALMLWINRDRFTPASEPAAPAATPPPMQLLPPQRMVAPPEKNVLVAPERIITAPRWLERPMGQDFERHYPPNALDQGVKGRVVLDCYVERSGLLTCTIAEETPMGYGFGQAALGIAQAFRMAPQTADGQPTYGGKVQVPIVFTIGR